MLKIIYLITIPLTAAVLFIIGCNKSSPPTAPPDDVKKDTIKIDIEYVTLKSVHLRLTAVDIKIPNDLN
jgi:hypothetical protein